MGHKGKNIRKAPKAKSKPLAGATPGVGVVSGLSQSPEKARPIPLGQTGMHSTPESNKRHKNR